MFTMEAPVWSLFFLGSSQSSKQHQTIVYKITQARSNRLDIPFQMTRALSTRHRPKPTNRTRCTTPTLRWSSRTVTSRPTRRPAHRCFRPTCSVPASAPSLSPIRRKFAITALSTIRTTFYTTTMRSTPMTNRCDLPILAEECMAAIRASTIMETSDPPPWPVPIKVATILRRDSAHVNVNVSVNLKVQAIVRKLSLTFNWHLLFSQTILCGFVKTWIRLNKWITYLFHLLYRGRHLKQSALKPSKMFNSSALMNHDTKYSQPKKYYV